LEQAGAIWISRSSVLGERAGTETGLTELAGHVLCTVAGLKRRPIGAVRGVVLGSGEIVAGDAARYG
jgi:hypothetical protein